MFSRICTTIICLFALQVGLPAQEDTGWRISPQKINIQTGVDRRLQLLDDNAQELNHAIWSVDDDNLAEIKEKDGEVVLHAKAIGTVKVTAALGGEMRSREINIWSSLTPLPPGITTWGVHPIGREIGDLPAVPTADGPTIFSLEQTESGTTYLRADAIDGFQVWTWQLPESTRDVELVCGDWMGGALISANHANSFTLYTVGKDGKLRWKYTLSGHRKGVAYDLQRLVHVLSQSTDGTATTLTALDEVNGTRKFHLALPVSQETGINVRRQGNNFLCASQKTLTPLPAIASHLLVNIDGFAYIAFTHNSDTLSTMKCVADTVLGGSEVKLNRHDAVLLWQIHPDGTYRSTTVEESTGATALTEAISKPSPTGEIIPDGFGGVLLPLRWSHDFAMEDVQGATDEYIDRINKTGDVVYKLAMPKYAGSLNDGMVLGEDDVAFTTRGGFLIAFNARIGRELWRWNSGSTDITVYAALANGHCLIEANNEVIEVESATRAHKYFNGKMMLGWQGDTYLKHN